QDFQVGQGTSFDFTHTYVGGGNGVKIWIDYDNDGDFAATEEVFYVASADLTKTGSIAVPLATPQGEYGMRVRSQYGSAANPTACGSTTYGTTLDFTLNVVAPPACLAPSDLVVDSVTTTTASFSWIASPSSAVAGYI